MKKIYALRVEGLRLPEEMAYYYFVVTAVDEDNVVRERFVQPYGMFRAAYDEQNDLYMRHDRKILTQIKQEKEAVRDKWFRKLRNNIREIVEFGEGETQQTAEFLSTIVDEYGGAKIPDMTEDAQTGVLLNLYEDLQEKYPEKVELLGLTQVVAGAKQANLEFIEAQNRRTQSDADYGKGAMAEVRVKTARMYRYFVDSVNLAAEVDPEGTLTPFIDYMNAKIDEMRRLAGQKPTDSNSGSGEEEDAYKYATFEFANGIKQSFPFAVGEPIIVPENTPGFIWKPAVPEFMPKTNRTFKEVPIEVEMGTAIFHFADHREEEIREAVGAILHALDNTEGYVWDPEVPEFMPAGETSYYEVLATPAEEMVTITFRYHDGREVVRQYPKGTILSQTTLEVPEHSPGYTWGNYHMPLNYDMTINEYNPNEL